MYGKRDLSLCTAAPAGRPDSTSPPVGSDCAGTPRATVGRPLVRPHGRDGGTDSLRGPISGPRRASSFRGIHLHQGHPWIPAASFLSAPVPPTLKAGHLALYNRPPAAEEHSSKHTEQCEQKWTDTQAVLGTDKTQPKASRAVRQSCLPETM